MEMGHEEKAKKVEPPADSGEAMCPVLQREDTKHQWQLCIAERAQETLTEAGGQGYHWEIKSNLVDQRIQ